MSAWPKYAEPDRWDTDRWDTDRWDGGPERAVLDFSTRHALLSAVRGLGAEQRECVVLHFLHGLSVAETGTVIGQEQRRGEGPAVPCRTVPRPHRAA